MSQPATTTTTERIRVAEERVARARDALDKAETGLRAAEKVSETVDEARTHPVVTTLAVLATAGLFALIIMKLRSGAGS